MQAVDSFAR